MRPSTAARTASADAVGRTRIGRSDVIQRRVVVRVMRRSVVMAVMVVRWMRSAVMMSMAGRRAVMMRVLRIGNVFGLRRMLVCRCILDPVRHAAARRASNVEMRVTTGRMENAEWIRSGWYRVGGGRGIRIAICARNAVQEMIIVRYRLFLLLLCSAPTRPCAGTTHTLGLTRLLALGSTSAGNLLLGTLSCLGTMSIKKSNRSDRPMAPAISDR